MLRVETDAQGLHVIESYFVKNDSNPPRTQFGPKAYEIYLPASAQVEASVAMGPGGMPVASPPYPPVTRETTPSSFPCVQERPVPGELSPALRWQLHLSAPCLPAYGKSGCCPAEEYEVYGWGGRLLSAAR